MARKNITIPNPNTSVPSSRAIIGFCEVPVGKITASVDEEVTTQSWPVKIGVFPEEYRLSQCHELSIEFLHNNF